SRAPDGVIGTVELASKGRRWGGGPAGRAPDRRPPVRGVADQFRGPWGADGPDAADGVRVTDQFPPGLTFASAAPRPARRTTRPLGCGMWGQKLPAPASRLPWSPRRPAAPRVGDRVQAKERVRPRQ